MYIPNLPVSFFNATTLGRRRRLPPNQSSFLFASGREAIWFGLKLLRLGKGDTVLIPCSLCWAAIEPLISFGLNIAYYSLDSGLRFRIDDILSRIDGTTKAIYTVHYFGFPQDLSSLREICASRNIALFEDCALCCYDGINNGGVGKCGDISIFSLWKFSAIPDGAVLQINSSVASASEELPSNVDLFETVNKTARLVIRGLAMNGLLPLAYFKQIRKTKEISDEMVLEFGKYPQHRMSLLSRLIWQRLDFEQISEKRRKNFLFLYSICENAGIVPLYKTLPPKVVPYSFPVIVNAPRFFQLMLLKRGVETEISVNPPFRDIPQLLNPTESFPDVEYLADHVVSLPIHQDLQDHHLKFLQNVLEQAL